MGRLIGPAGVLDHRYQGQGRYVYDIHYPLANYDENNVPEHELVAASEVKFGRIPTPNERYFQQRRN